MKTLYGVLNQANEIIDLVVAREPFKKSLLLQFWLTYDRFPSLVALENFDLYEGRKLKKFRWWNIVNSYSERASKHDWRELLKDKEVIVPDPALTNEIIEELYARTKDWLNRPR